MLNNILIHRKNHAKTLSTNHQQENKRKEALYQNLLKKGI